MQPCLTISAHVAEKPMELLVLTPKVLPNDNTPAQMNRHVRINKRTVWRQHNT